MSVHSADRRNDHVEFIHEDDGTITARDDETGLARGGDTRSAALSQLAEVLALAEGRGEPIEDSEAFLQDLGIDPDAHEQTDRRPPWE